MREAAYARQGGLCYWCEQPMLLDVPANHSRACTADHLLFRAKGGRTRIDNIVAACRRCNNNRHPE